MVTSDTPFAVFAMIKESKTSSNFLPEFLFTKRLFLDINQTSSLPQKSRVRDEVCCFYEKSGISTFSSRNPREKKKKASNPKIQGFLELLGRFELPTSSLPRMRSTC